MNITRLIHRCWLAPAATLIAGGLLLPPPRAVAQSTARVSPLELSVSSELTGPGTALHALLQEPLFARVEAVEQARPDPASSEDQPRTAVRLAQKAITDAANNIGRAVAVAFTPGGRPRTLVLPDAAVKPSEADQMGEDLSVMSRILTKAIGRREGAEQFFYSGDGWGMIGRGLDALYLDGFGALFLLSVDFPLVAAAEKPDEPEVEATDQVWEEARRELSEHTRVWEPRLLDIPMGGAQVEFSKARVADLKENLVQALKHSSNLTGVKADETIAVAVFGPPASGAKDLVMGEKVRRTVR